MLRARFDRNLDKSWFETVEKRDAMEILRDMIETGQLTPVLGRTFPLEKAPAAIQCLQVGRTNRRIVIVP